MITVPDYVKPGDFGLVHMGGQGGKWINIGQKINSALRGDKSAADYQHAFIYAGVGSIVEAMPSGAKANPFHYSTGVLWSSQYITLTALDRIAIVSAACEYIGVGYSWVDYFAIATHTLHLPHAPNLKEYVASSKHMICSQLVDQCYQDAGVHLFNDGRWPGYVTPDALAGLLHPGASVLASYPA
jgi:cell wall-associated NlpC family hydrolase